MNAIDIAIREKIATKICDTVYICGNSDFIVRFDFDEEWNDYEAKTVRFVTQNNEHVDVPFVGNECEVPVFSDVYNFRVGVFAGNLHTTTSAYVPCKKSILCGTGDKPLVPEEEAYDQMMEAINADAVRAETAANTAVASADAAEKAQKSALDSASAANAANLAASKSANEAKESANNTKTSETNAENSAKAAVASAENASRFTGTAEEAKNAASKSAQEAGEAARVAQNAANRAEAAANTSVIKVGANGQYATIQEAVNAAKDGDTISVEPGVYVERLKVHKNVRIIGENRYGCVLQSTVEDYANPPLEMSEGEFGNFQVFGYDGGAAVDGVSLAYCLHVENDNSENSSLYVHDVDFHNYVMQTVGIGMRANFKLMFEDCTFTCYTDLAAFYCHSSVFGGINQNLYMVRCFFRNGGYSPIIRMQSQNIPGAYALCEWIDCKTIPRTTESIEMINWDGSSGHDGWMGSADWHISGFSMGNTVTELNPWGANPGLNETDAGKLLGVGYAGVMNALSVGSGLKVDLEKQQIEVVPDEIDVFVIRASSATVIDKTYADITAAKNNELAIVLVDWLGNVYSYSGMEGTDHVFTQVYYPKNTQDGAVRARRAVVSENGTIEVRPVAGFPRATNPYKLVFTGAVNDSYDGSKQVTVNIPEGGGTGLPTGGDPHQMLVTDAEGKAKWEEKRLITGVEDENGNITFSMPLSDMFALGDELANYDISICDSRRNRYRVNYCTAITTAIYLYCSMIDPNDRLVTRTIKLTETSAKFTGTTKYFPIYELPIPAHNPNAYLGTDETGKYVLKEAPTGSASMPVLQVIDADGVLAFIDMETGQTMVVTLEMLVSVYGDSLTNLKLLVTNVNTGTDISIFSFGYIYLTEDLENPPYILFSGEMGKTIRMDYEGTLSYVPELKLATEEYVQTYIEETLLGGAW